MVMTGREPPYDDELAICGGTSVVRRYERAYSTCQLGADGGARTSVHVKPSGSLPAMATKTGSGNRGR